MATLPALKYPRGFCGAALACVFFLAMPESGGAQAARRNRGPTVEGRVDAIFSSVTAVHAGIGVTASLGTYLRSGFISGAGASEDGASGRIDFINRFHLDPFRESRWAPYAGGGVTMRFEGDRHGRLYLLVFVGVDGPVGGGLTPSLEVGLGGGGRIGVIIRRAAAQRR